MREYNTKKKASYYKEVLRLRISEGYSIRKIAKIFPVPINTVSRWIHIFEGGNQKKSYVMKDNPTTKPSGGVCGETPEELRRRIRDLEKRLEDAEFRAEAYKTMIEVAESMGMPVRKKAGAKR